MRWLIALAVASVMALAAVPALAGRFHVYSCRTPDRGVAPVDGWSGATTGTFTYATNTCASGGALLTTAAYATSGSTVYHTQSSASGLYSRIRRASSATRVTCTRP